MVLGQKRLENRSSGRIGDDFVKLEGAQTSQLSLDRTAVQGDALRSVRPQEPTTASPALALPRNHRTQPEPETRRPVPVSR